MAKQLHKVAGKKITAQKAVLTTVTVNKWALPSGSIYNRGKHYSKCYLSMFTYTSSAVVVVGTGWATTTTCFWGTWAGSPCWQETEWLEVKLIWQEKAY